MFPPRGHAAIATLPAEQGDRFIIVTHAPGGRFHLTGVICEDDGFDAWGTRWPCRPEQVLPSALVLGLNPLERVPWHLFECPSDHRNVLLDLEEVEMLEFIEVAFERGTLVRARAGAW